jgi:hypothetical protein
MALSACAGMYFFVVEPAERALHEVSKERAALQVRQSAAMHASRSSSQLSALTLEAARAADAIDAGSQAARDESRLYMLIMDLAEQTGVEIESLDPGVHVTIQRASAVPDGAASGEQAVEPAAQTPRNVSLPCTMTLVGDYASVATFLERVNSSLGYCVVRSVRVWPDEQPGSGKVRADVSTEHFAFDVERVRMFLRPAAQAESRGALETMP